MFATLIFVNGNALPSGRYYINESYSSGSVQAGGIDGGSVYPTFYGTLSEDGFINIPLWLFKSGYVDVSYNEYNELTLDMNGTNSWGRSGRVILYCGNVFGSGYDPGYNPGDDPNYDPDNDPWEDFDPTITYRGNVIKDGRAPVITLYDKSPVNIPQGFYADSVRFSRWFNEDMLSSRNGRAGGWVGLVLPFSVQHIYSDWKGELAPFGAASANQRPFWVAHQNYSAQGYELSSSIEANRPYIVCMPNDPDQYDPEYNIYGNVTFSARNAWMNNTYESWTEGLNYNLHSAYDYVPKSEDVYALNTTNTASYYAGGAFVSNLRNVEPFEVYARSNSYARPPYYAIGGEDDTVGIEQILGQSISAAGLSLRCYSMAGDLYIVSSANLDEALPIYALNGQIVKEVAVKAGTTTVKGLASGIYVIGGQKVPVFGQAK